MYNEKLNINTSITKKNININPSINQTDISLSSNIGSSLTSWGSITGVLSNQADLYSILIAKITLSDLSSEIIGLRYDKTTGVFSLLPGYEIPKSEQFQNLWDTLNEEIQNRINQCDILQSNISSEESSRINEDNILRNKIDTEIENREISDTRLDNILNQEISERKSVDQYLEDKINQLIETDKHFIFEQGIATNHWIINHNLNKQPSVVAVDTAGVMQIPDEIVYIDKSTVEVYFIAPFAGKAYLN